LFDLWPATLPDTSAANKIAAEAPGKEKAAEKRKEEDKKKKEFEEKLNSHNPSW
jgi:ribosomal protein L12E/L44/L45/RPP1/RPP2